MRKIMTFLVMVMFLATAMFFSGCATSKSLKDMHEEIQGSLRVLDEQGQKNKEDIETLKEDLGTRLDRINDGLDHFTFWAQEIADKIGVEFKRFEPEAVTVAKAEVTTSPEVTTEVLKEAEPPKVVKPEVIKVEVPKLTETLEYRLAKLTERVDVHEKRLDTVEKRVESWPNLYAYVKDLNARFNTMKAKYRFASGPAEATRSYIIGPFGKDKFGLNKTIENQIRKKVAPDIKKRNLKIEGVHAFASQDGPEDYNKTLSEARAKTIANCLKEESLEVPKDKILGLGESTDFGDKFDNRCAVIFATPKSTSP